VQKAAPKADLKVVKEAALKAALKVVRKADRKAVQRAAHPAKVVATVESPAVDLVEVHAATRREA